ncbi:hypothetical protein T4E_662 [Trichinella pseudospiralis]|uniref:Uncharacterized protein n=1 Tax=Trichinella pseudospiralis TaxID=6337 RepID=A0A0V0XXW7_TRIPS|nr:hypothetical protein T4E_662 [Trichinella pseudospiralis]
MLLRFQRALNEGFYVIKIWISQKRTVPVVEGPQIPNNF